MEEGQRESRVKGHGFTFENTAFNFLSEPEAELKTVHHISLVLHRLFLYVSIKVSESDDHDRTN